MYTIFAKGHWISRNKVLKSRCQARNGTLNRRYSDQISDFSRRVGDTRRWLAVALATRRAPPGVTDAP